MTTSSTSVTIKWANSKLAEMLRKKEEEEALLRGNRVRHKDERSDDAKRPRRRSWSAQIVEDKPVTQRWSGKVDYSKPSPLRDRPRSESGATSFHFAVSQISKEVSPTYNKKPVTGFKAGSETPGADHELYIGRELATEQAQDMEAYIARQGAVEIDDAILEREPGRTFGDEIAEGLEDLTVARDAQGVPSIFSNISDDPFERAEFWKAVHRTEREPRVQTILVDASKNPELVRQIMSDERLPASFREVAALAYQDAATPLDIDAPRLRPRKWKGDAEACGKVLVRLQSYDGFDPRRSGISYKSGIGGTVQHRLVAELPHELTAAERAALVLRFCQHLEQIEKNEDGSSRGLMYTAAIHAPDAHNDARNYHLHVVFHDRPARMIPGLGMWDFEVAEVFERKGEIRTRYPYRQTKVSMVNGLSEGSDPEISGRNFIPALRREFSQITNEALERAGIERRYDPRTYKAMGIERTPTDHLGAKAAALEAAGVETTVGSLNAMKIWRDAQRDIERRTEQRKGAIGEREAILLDLMTEGAREPAAAQPLANLRAAVSEWSRTARDVTEDRELVDGFDLMEDKARSRADKLRATCLRTLADIEIGTAPSRDVRAKAKIEKRYEDASAWLAQIDAALSDERDDIEKARDKIVRDEERVVVLSEKVDALADDLRKALAASRAAGARTTTKGAAPKAPRGPIEGLVDIMDIGSLDEAPAASGPRKAATASQPDAAQDAAAPASSEPVKAAPATDKVEAPAQAAPQPSTAAPAVTPAPAASERKPGVTADKAVGPAAKEPPRVPPVTTEQKDATPPAKAGGPATKAAEPPAPAKSVEPIKEQANTPQAPAPGKVVSEPAAQPPARSKPVPEPMVPKVDTPAPAPAPVPPKIDKPAPAPAEPAQFDLPTQPAPVKPGSQAERQKQWNLLFDRVQSENLFILPAQPAKGSPLGVPALTQEERALLDAPEFAKRTQARLGAMKQSQDYAINRLGKWLQANGHDESKLAFGDRRFHYRDTPQAIQTLLEKYRHHPEVLPQLERGMKTQATIREVVEWVRTEGQKGDNLRLSDGYGEIAEHAQELRQKLSEVIQYQPVKAALREEYNRRQREIERASEGQGSEREREAAGRMKIDVSQVRHPLVREFAKGINANRQPEELHAIAKRIEITKQAREELLSLGREVGIAYTRAANTRPDSKAPASRGCRERDF